MKASYILFALAASITATASPLVVDNDTNMYGGGAMTKPTDPHRAPDPPPAP